MSGLFVVGQVVQKPVNANLRLKVNQSIIFSFYTNVFHCFWLLVWFEIIQNQNKAKQYKQKTSLQSYKTQIKILTHPGLA